MELCPGAEDAQDGLHRDLGAFGDVLEAYIATRLLPRLPPPRRRGWSCRVASDDAALARIT